MKGPPGALPYPPRTLLIANFSTDMKTDEDEIPDLIDDDDDIVTRPRIAAKRPEYTSMRDYPPSQQSSPGAHHNLLTATMVVNDLNVVDIFSQSASQSVRFSDTFDVGSFSLFSETSATE